MIERTPGSTVALQEALSRLEVDAYGVASVADLAGSRLHQQVTALLPSARSVVAFAMEIFPEVLDHSRPNKVMGEANLRDLLVPHMEYLNGRVNKAAYDMAKLSRSRGLKALPMTAGGSPTDQRYLAAALSYKHVAEAAGLGNLGLHSLLVTPEYGPRVRLACVLTEADLQPTPRVVDRLCNDCNDCIQACPSGALSEPRKGEAYAINKFACQAFRGASGGCSECMRECPQGQG